MSNLKAVLAATAFLAAAANTAMAQQVTGSLAAIVTDSSGAVIPNAKVTITNAASGDLRRSVTNAEGYFSVTGIYPGTYNVSVEAPGFSIYKVERLTFNSGDVRTLPNIVLEVGSVGTEVRVVDALEGITPVDSGEKATVITTQQLQNVAVVSRSAAEFIKIVPGFVPVAGIDNRPGWNGENMGINGNGDGGKQSAIGNYSANGTPTAALDITMDGAHTADPGCNCATPVNPNPDMISEVKIQTSNFAAENYKGPVVISAITKSGGRDFHGTGYMFARHHALYSNDWYNNKLGIKKPENKYFFPGGNIGGPVLIPGTGFNRNRDKLFFFAGYEYFKQTIDSGLIQAIVPTNAMRQGDFTDTAYLNAINRTFSAAGADIAEKFPTRRVPVDPGMRQLLALVPQPNIDPGGAGNGYNWAQVLNIDQNMWQFATKVDYNVSDYTKLFVRYNRQREVQPFPVQLWWRNAGAVPLPTPVEGRNKSDSIAGNFTKVLSPTLTNEFVFGYTFVDFPNSYQDYSRMTKTANNYPYQGLFRQDDKIPGFLSWSGPIAGMWLPGGFDPVLFATKHLFTLNNTVSKIVDTHTMKFGFYFGRITNAQPGNEPSAGLIQFSNGHALTSGNVLADMVAGLVDSYTENSMQINRNMGWNEFALFAQDSWKIRRNLTLEFGLRAQHMQPWTARNGIGIAAWVPSLYNPSAPASTFPGLGWNQQNPEVPLSGWDTKAIWWAPRFGMAWDIFGTGRTVLRGGWGRFIYHDAQLAASAMDMPAGVRRTTLAGGLNLRDVDARAGSAAGDLVFGGDTVDSTDYRHPLTDSYSFTISQRLPGRILGEIAYVGNETRNLVNGGAIANINNVPLGAMLNDPTGDPNSYRPLRNWQDLRVFSHNLYSNYNSLQALIAKQTGRTNFTLAYTWGKALGITNNDLNPFDLRQAYGPLAFDRRHNLSTSYVVNLPTFIGAGGNPFARGLVNGWQVSGIVVAYSGSNLQLNSKDANFGLNAPNPNGTGAINSQWVTGTNATRLMPRLTCDPREGLQDGQYINGSCFAPPIPGSNGQPGVNGPYVMPFITGPAFWQADLSLFKEFTISESKRLQFRAQAYNFLNHPLSSFIGNSDANITANFNSAGTLTNPRFGFTDNKVGRRSMMLGVKFYF
jgi:hypothetical protein